MPEDDKQAPAKPAETASSSPVVVNTIIGLIGIVAEVTGTGFFNSLVERQKAKNELRLERHKADTDLVKLALQAPDEQSRIASLRFMVATNLISDAEIRKGVSAYLPSSPASQKQTIPYLGPKSSMKGEIQMLALGQSELDFAEKNAEALKSYGFSTRPPKTDERLKKVTANKVVFFNSGDLYLAEEIMAHLKAKGLDDVSIVYSDRNEPPGYVEVLLIKTPPLSK